MAGKSASLAFRTVPPGFIHMMNFPVVAISRENAHGCQIVNNDSRLVFSSPKPAQIPTIRAGLPWIHPFDRHVSGSYNHFRRFRRTLPLPQTRMPFIPNISAPGQMRNNAPISPHRAPSSSPATDAAVHDRGPSLPEAEPVPSGLLQLMNTNALGAFPRFVSLLPSR
ncbi:hypothetical protein C8Q77DRAFT_802795 [Trametes polyzona]|nr:hypothetical protein C8Q77DRAFT_802795 [Trametes polyzona]